MPAAQPKEPAAETPRPPAKPISPIPDMESSDFDGQTKFLEQKKMEREKEERRKAQEYEVLLEHSKFACILPIGKRIHLNEISAVLAQFLGIDETAARRRIRAGKGVLLMDLAYDDMVEFYRSLVDCPQKVQFIRQAEEADFGAPQEVISIRPNSAVARVTTDRAQFKMEWQEVKLLSTGRILIARSDPARSQLIADIFLNKPRKHLRLFQSTFNVHAYGTIDGDPDEQFRSIVLSLRDHCPKAIRSHTIDLLSKQPAADLQPFESTIEYDNYNRWLLLSNLCEEINPARRRSKAATNY